MCVQNVGEENIIDLPMYRLKLMDDGNASSDSDSKPRNSRGLEKGQGLKRIKRYHRSSSSSSASASIPSSSPSPSSSSHESSDDEMNRHVKEKRKSKKTKKKENDNKQGTAVKFGRSLSYSMDNRPKEGKYSKFDVLKKCMSDKKNKIELKRSLSEMPKKESSYAKGHHHHPTHEKKRKLDHKDNRHEKQSDKDITKKK